MFPQKQSEIVEMHCKGVRRLMTEYLDGDLGLETFVRIDAHLEYCAHCAALYDGVRNIVTLLGSEEAFEVPAGLGDLLYDRLSESQG